MAPRRGGDGGAGLQSAALGARNALDVPPLKRMHPWQQNGAGQCEIVAGGVDDSGIFKGVHIVGVHLMALLRTFQLSKTFLPVDTAPPLAELGQSLQDGLPLIIVTRGCFGREMDQGPGPVRNDIQRTIWELCRQMRADMPQVLITCIDLPINLPQDVLRACFTQPLSEYRELMYHDGTWYTPALLNASSLAKWKDEARQEKLQKVNNTSNGDLFSRKKFGWINAEGLYKDCFTLGWKPVLKQSDPPAVPVRTDLIFTAETAPGHGLSPNGAH